MRNLDGPAGLDWLPTPHRNGADRPVNGETGGLFPPASFNFCKNGVQDPRDLEISLWRIKEPPESYRPAKFKQNSFGGFFHII